MEEGLGGLLRDKTLPSRIAPLGPEVAERVAALRSGCGRALVTPPPSGCASYGT